jgi:glycosyltransferase involved in cell wall biosynthesis
MSKFPFSVAILLPGPPIGGGGGAERRLLRVWKALNDRGVHCLLIVNKSLFQSFVDCGIIREEDGDDSGVISVSSFIWTGIPLLMAVRRAGCDLIHVPLQRRLFFFYLLLCLWPNRPVVSNFITCSFLSTRYVEDRLTRICGKLLWSLSSGIETLYRSFVDNWAEPGGFGSKVRVAACSFTDTNRFNPGLHKERLITFSGRLIPEKGPMLFVEALSRLKTDLPWRAVIAGDGPLKGDLIEAVGRLVPNHAVDVGPIADLSDVLAVSSIFVSLQVRENYPSQALLEAMASGNAVIATEVGETGKLVRHRENGLLIPAGNPDALAEAIRTLLERPDFANLLAKKARETVLTEHSEGRYLDHLLGFWRETMSSAESAVGRVLNGRGAGEGPPPGSNEH